MTSPSLYTIIETLPEKLKLEVKSFIEKLIEKSKSETFSNETKNRGKRAFGSLKGKISLTEDFDAPLEDFKSYM